MAHPPRDLGDDQAEQKRWFQAFLESEGGRRTLERLDGMVAAGGTRLLVDFDDVRDHSQGQLRDDEVNVTVRAQQRPNDHLPYWALAVSEAVERRAAVDYLKKGFQRRTCKLGIEGNLGHCIVTPRSLRSCFMGQLVMVDGIVTRCSIVRPKLLESVHYSEAKNEFLRREYRDELSPFIDATHLPTINVFPKKDADGNPLRTEYGLCTYSDHQTLMLQEMPETAPVGQLPRSVDIRLEDDLVDTVKPGDRVRICGVYQAYTNTGQPKKGEDQSVRFQTVLVANHIIHLGKKLKQPELTAKDRSNIARLAKQKAPTELLPYLAQGVAPSIYGLEYEKQAVLLMLLGGEERRLEHTRIRGDMNILLVGEPSTGKSQLLRFVLNLAPLALSTTGRGSSGVGLTAAVTVDRDSGEKTLSAGAMVLGDRGLVCIDEFDKMSEGDRVAMHEAMEQGSVTIAKAGIHASLNSRCSVLAAANPVYGFYLPQLKAANIGLPESLQSRFDLIFIVLDQGHSAEYNKLIAAHVIETHRSAPPADKQGPMDDELGTGRGGTSNPIEMFGGRKLVNVHFLRKYIQYAKANFHPTLNEEAHKEVVEAYVELRERMKAKEISMRITPRSLENIIRLSTAHAKLRLSTTVEKVDVDVAYRLIKYSMAAVDSERPGPDADGAAEATEPPSKKARVDCAGEPTPATAPAEPPADYTPDEQALLALISKALRFSEGIELRSLHDAINASREFSKRPITTGALDALLRKMESKGQVMYDEGRVYPYG